MKLRQKTLLIISATLVGMVGLLYVAASTILQKAIEQAEQQSARQTVQGVLNILTQTTEEFSNRFSDWATWDDTYEFIQDRNQNYIQSNLNPGTLTNLRLNLILYVNSAGKLVYGTGFDLNSRRYTPIPETVQKHLVLGDRLLHHPDRNSNLEGILMVPQGAMLIASRPILPSEEDRGAIRGSFIVGRLLNAGEVKQLARIARLPLDLQAVDDPNLPSDFQMARAALSRQDSFFLQNQGDQAIAGYAPIKDIYDRPALLLRVIMPRDIYKHGQRSFLSLISAVILTGLIFGMVTLLLLQRLVLSRVARLSTDVRQIGEKRNFKLRVDMSGKDELPMLASDINRMLAALEQSQQAISQKNHEMSGYIRQVEQVIEAAIAVETNTFKPEQLNSVAVRSDKLGQLAQVFIRMVRTVTTREQELAEAKEQLEAVLDAVPGSISWVNSSGVYLGVNRRLAEAWNLTQDALIGKEIGFCKEGPQFVDFLRRFLATDEKSAAQVIEVPLNGTVKYYLVAAQKYQNRTATVTVGIDITERKQAEEALQESKQQLNRQNAALVELTRNKALSQGDWQTAIQKIITVAARTLEVERASVWLYSEEKASIYCVDSFALTANYHSQESELTAASYPAYFRALEADEIIAAQDAYTDPRTAELGDSYMKPFGITAILDAPIRLGGETIGVLCLERVDTPHLWTLEEQGFVRSVADLVTLAIEAHQRNQAEEALRIAEENYRSIFENALEGIFQSTPDGRYLSINPSLARIYGYDSPQEMVECIANIAQQIYVDPEYRDEFRYLMEENDQVQAFEYRTYQKDGSIIWVEENTRAVRDNSGKLLYYEGIVQDISDRKRREDELRRQLEELKIEIDQNKREKEVAMLTESNYFKEIQQEIAEVNLDEFWS